MGNIARRIIDAVQNSLLDRLVLQMIHLLAPIMFLGTIGSTSSGLAALWLILTIVVLTALAWLLGAIANRRPRRHTPYESLHNPPANGFEAWSEPPEGGLRPSRVMRRLVMTLAIGRASPWPTVLSVALYFSAFAILLALTQGTGAFGMNIHPALSDPETRANLSNACTILIALLLLRDWAVKQSNRLTPLPETGTNSKWASWAVAFLFLTFALSLVATFFRLPYWSGVAATVAILTLSAILPAPRDRVLDFLFGTREDPA